MPFDKQGIQVEQRPCHQADLSSRFGSVPEALSRLDETRARACSAALNPQAVLVVWLRKALAIQMTGISVCSIRLDGCNLH